MESRNRGARRSDTITYRPKRPYALAVGLTVAIIAVGLAPALLGWDWLCAPLGWVGMLPFVLTWQQTLSGAKVRYLIDDDSLTFRDGKVAKRVPWDEVIAYDVDRDAKLVSFLTATQAVDLSLGAYDEQDVEAILTQIYHRVPENSIDPKDYTAKPEYQAAVQRAAAEWAAPAKPLVVRDPGVGRIVGWVSFGFFAILTIMFSANEETRGDPSIWGFAFFSLSSLILVAFDGISSVDAQHLMRVYPMLRLRYRIAWDEVERIEKLDGQNLVFQGGSRQLVMPDFRAGQGLDRGRFAEFVAAQIEQRGIPVKTSIRAIFRVQRCTRVKSHQ